MRGEYIERSDRLYDGVELRLGDRLNDGDDPLLNDGLDDRLPKDDLGDICRDEWPSPDPREMLRANETHGADSTANAVTKLKRLVI